MFIKESNIKRKLKTILLMAFNYIENNGNSCFDKNGEGLFVSNLLEQYKKDNTSKMRVIFDIGANIGKYAQIIQDKSTETDIEVHLFEPTKNCFEVLTSKFEKNSNFILNNFGVSDIDTKREIFYDKPMSGLASLYQRNLDSYNLKLNQSEEIILKRLDDYISAKNIKHIDFIKIDIEGHELKAFEGFGKYLNSSFIDLIQFEYGGANLDSHSSLMEIYNFFENRGFKIAKIMPKGLELREYKPYMDNFQYANYVAISNKVV